jgi:hypothetical protein
MTLSDFGNKFDFRIDQRHTCQRSLQFVVQACGGCCSENNFGQCSNATPTDLRRLKGRGMPPGPPGALSYNAQATLTTPQLWAKFLSHVEEMRQTTANAAYTAILFHHNNQLHWMRKVVGQYHFVFIRETYQQEAGVILSD